MDARRIAHGTCAWLALALPGCALLGQGWGPQPPKAAPTASAAPAAPALPAVNAAAPGDRATPATATQDPDAGLSEIESWASQVADRPVPRRDDLFARLERQAAGPPTAAPSAPEAVLIADARSSDSPPADSADESLTSDATAAPIGAGQLIDPAAPPGTGGPAPSAPAPAAPPTLQNVIVRPGATSLATQARAVPPPGVNAPQQALDAPANLQVMLDRIAAESADASFREQFERRVLHALAGRDEQAREPLQLFSAGQQELVSGFVELLIHMRDAPPGDAAGSLKQAQEAIARLEKSIRQVSGIQIAALQICSRVDGFGRYAVIDPPEFPAGRASEFVAYCEAADFMSERNAQGAWRSAFSLRIELLDRIGQAVHAQEADEIVDVCQSRRRDCFIAPLVSLPAALSPGQYVLKVTLIDKIAGKVAQRRTTLRVAARP